MKTLRYYHQIGLLEPSRADSFTGYRYYTAVQLARLNHILALKDLDFSLDQIRQMLDDDLSPGQIRGLLRLKRAEITRQIEADQARLARLDSRLTQIEKEAKIPRYKIPLRQLCQLRKCCVVIPRNRGIFTCTG